MKKYLITEGVVCGEENNPDLFLRKVTFSADYQEELFHYHKDSFEFYLVLAGDVVFESGKGEQMPANQGTVIYFAEAEKHRIVSVGHQADLLLIKKIKSKKVIQS